MLRDGWTDEWTDGKSDIERWVPHLKKSIRPSETNLLQMKQKSFILEKCLLLFFSDASLIFLDRAWNTVN